MSRRRIATTVVMALTRSAPAVAQPAIGGDFIAVAA